jgi:hypothetical protein
MPDPDGPSPVNDGADELPANPETARIRGDRERTHLRLVRCPQEVAARPAADHDSAEYLVPAGAIGVLADRDENIAITVCTQRAQARRVGRVGRQESVGQVSSDSDLADGLKLVWPRVTYPHTCI